MNFTQGQQVRLRIAVTLIQFHNLHGWTVNYLGERFLVAVGDIAKKIDARTALIDIPGVIVRPTGKASFLVKHGDHQLRVHVQQIRAEVRAA